MQEIEILKVNGKTMQHRIVEMPADGSCLFHCIAYSIYNEINNNRTMRIRHDIVNCVCHNWTEYKDWTCNEMGDNYASVEEYRSDMSLPTTYGAASELKAAAFLYNLQFEIYNNGKHLITFGTVDNPIKRVRFIGRLAYGHYDMYMPIEENYRPY